MGSCCCRGLEPGLELATLLAPLCKDDLDTCPAFVIWGMFYISDNWKQALGSHCDSSKSCPSPGFIFS